MIRQKVHPKDFRGGEKKPWERRIRGNATVAVTKEVYEEKYNDWPPVDLKREKIDTKETAKHAAD